MASAAERLPLPLYMNMPLTTDSQTPDTAVHGRMLPLQHPLQDSRMSGIDAVLDWDTGVTTPSILPESKVGTLPAMHPMIPRQHGDYQDDMSDSGCSNATSSTYVDSV